jgi:hypothetical protein
LAAHRGGIQAQGKNLEESVSWKQENPLTAEDVKLKITELKDKLSKMDLKVREDAFKRAERFIDNACPCGVQGDSKKTFLVKGTASERVDIEVNSGLAFTGE